MELPLFIFWNEVATRFHGVKDRHLDNKLKMQTFVVNYKNRHPWIETLRTQNALYVDIKKNEDLEEKYNKLKTN